MLVRDSFVQLQKLLSLRLSKRFGKPFRKLELVCIVWCLLLSREKVIVLILVSAFNFCGLRSTSEEFVWRKEDSTRKHKHASWNLSQKKNRSGQTVKVFLGRPLAMTTSYCPIYHSYRIRVSNTSSLLLVSPQNKADVLSETK